MRPPRRLALFDLDGTLLDGDTDELWCEFLIAEGRLDGAKFRPGNRDISARYAAGTITADAYCAFYAALLGGESAAWWAPWRDRFVRDEIVPRLPMASHALVEQHRTAGDTLVLTTATNRFLTEPIAHALDIETLLATELETIDGCFTGRNSGVLNMRAGKVERLRAWLAVAAVQADAGAAGSGDVDPLRDAVFYSDSVNDLPLLLAVGEPVAVNADAWLRAEAERRGWRRLQLDR